MFTSCLSRSSQKNLSGVLLRPPSNYSRGEASGRLSPPCLIPHYTHIPLEKWVGRGNIQSKDPSPAAFHTLPSWRLIRAVRIRTWRGHTGTSDRGEESTEAHDWAGAEPDSLYVYSQLMKNEPQTGKRIRFLDPGS